jgi:hypothetical protein
MDNENNESRKKVVQKLATKQKRNPDPVEKQGDPGFWLSFPFAPAKQILNIFDYVWWLLVF